MKKTLSLVLVCGLVLNYYGCSEKDNDDTPDSPECTKDADCAARTDNKTKCDTSAQICIEPESKPECTNDADCADRTDNRTKCDTSAQICIETEITNFPAKFDLREKGLVTPVKAQDPWNTCWAFAASSAAETSILAHLGMTSEEYKKANGGYLDLSEKHLAWFAEHPVTDKTSDSQAGEGMFTIGAENNPHIAYTNGGLNLMVTTLFSSGVGPVFESAFPYQGKEGLTTSQYIEKHPEVLERAAREFVEINLFDVSYDEAFRLIKEVPLGEQAKSWVETLQNAGYLDKNKDVSELTEAEFKEMCLDVYTRSKTGDDGNREYSKYDDWTIPELGEDGHPNRDLTAGFTLLDGNKLPEVVKKDTDNNYEGINQEAMNAIKSELMKGHGVAIAFKSDVSRPDEANNGKYMNMNTWAHYTYEVVMPSHAVNIVGWDDDYPVENFIAAHQPPAKGAWIVKNSWGSETDYIDRGEGIEINKKNWGIKNEEGKHTGYFYISYYDKTLINPETMSFDTDLVKAGGEFSVWAYDYMPSMQSFWEDTSIQEKTSLKTANVFKNDSGKDLHLYGISTKTANPNATVEYSIYLLNADAKNPEDGQLLGKKTAKYLYAGFHREKLDGSITIKPNEKLAIVAEESIVKNGEKLYEFAANVALTKEAAAAKGDTDYGVAVVNEGESFFYTDGKWIDWTVALKKLQENKEYSGTYVMDNFSIKAYMIAK